MVQGVDMLQKHSYIDNCVKSILSNKGHHTFNFNSKAKFKIQAWRHLAIHDVL